MYAVDYFGNPLSDGAGTMQPHCYLTEFTSKCLQFVQAVTQYTEYHRKKSRN